MGFISPLRVSIILYFSQFILRPSLFHFIPLSIFLPLFIIPYFVNSFNLFLAGSKQETRFANDLEMRLTRCLLCRLYLRSISIYHREIHAARWTFPIARIFIHHLVRNSIIKASVSMRFPCVSCPFPLSRSGFAPRTSFVSSGFLFRRTFCAGSFVSLFHCLSPRFCRRAINLASSPAELIYCLQA